MPGGAHGDTMTGMVRLVCACSLLLIPLVAPQPAAAAVSAATSVVTSGGKTRLVVKLTSPKAVAKRSRPSAVSVVAKGRTYRLTRVSSSAAIVRLGTWRSAGYTGTKAAALRALAGTKVKVRLVTPAGTRTLSSKIPSASTPAPVTPAPGTPTPTTQPLFTPPASDLTGNAAYEAFKGYLADSRFTSCPAGWPACGPVEYRYAHFADGTQWYCRLTSTSGSDIRSVGSIAQITGAEMKTDGSWGVEYRLNSYGNVTFYSWRVTAAGAVSGLYYGPGLDPTNSTPTETITGLVWVRGARDCTY